MASDAASSWMTIILIKNIHCASCVSYIEEVLSPYRPAIRNVDINVMTGEVRIVHDPKLPASNLHDVLDDAAFDVYSTATVDEAGREQIAANEDGEEKFFDASEEANTVTLPGQTRHRRGQSSCIQIPKKRKRHSEVCGACKKEQEEEDEAIRQVENDFGSLDLEKWGDISLSGGSRKFCSRTEDTLVGSADTRDSAETTGEAPLKEESEYKATFSVGGMTCASCTSAISNGLEELAFVESVDVSLMTNSATVIFKGKSNTENLVAAVEDLGYDCGIESCEPLHPGNSQSSSSSNAERSVMLKVEGMFCKHCPPKILDALGKNFGNRVTIAKPPSLADPIVDITFTPELPQFTLRDIVACMKAVNEDFKVYPYQPPSMEERSQQMQRHEQRRLLLRLLLSFIVAIPTFLIGIAWMSLVPECNNLRQFFDEAIWSGNVARRDWALFFLATPVFFLAGDVFHVRAVKEIRSLWRRKSRVPIFRRFYRFGSMNLLISAGTSVAYISSIAVLAMDATEEHHEESMGQTMTYFDSVVFLTFFILIGRWLEAYSKAKTSNAVSLLGKLKPQEAILVSTKQRPIWSTAGQFPVMSQFPAENIPTHTTIPVDSNLLEVGDTVLVRHGSSPPADGIVVSGNTKFNESSLTGESKPVVKHVDDKVFAGSVNVGEAIRVRVTEIGGTSMLDQIVSAVREGQTKRAPVERIVDIVTGYFVPVVTALAIITWLVWLALGQSGALSTKYLGSSQRGGWAFWSLEFAIAVFVVACPCGIGLAAPTALFVGSGLAAKHGILVRGGGEAFQEASKVDAVVFDKTGTLTEGGDLKVTDHEVLVNGDEVSVSWAIAKLLEESSDHPIAQAVQHLASQQPSDPSLVAQSISEEPGNGLRGTFTANSGSYEAAIGSEAFISSLDSSPTFNYFTGAALSQWKTQAKSVAVLALRHTPKDQTPSQPTPPWTISTIFATSDPIRPSAFPTLAALKARNIPTYILTGDNATTAAAVASTLSVPADHVFAGVLPTQKAEKIRWLQEHASRLHSQRRSLLTTLLTKLHFRAPSPGSVAHEHEHEHDDDDGNKKAKAKAKAKAIIAFLGDGTNDAPALTAANVSISLSHTATAIALSSSSFILLSPTSPLSQLLTLLSLSARVFRRVKFNFFWAAVYNAILVPVAAGVFLPGPG